MSRLGINAHGEVGYKNQFGISLKKRDPSVPPRLQVVDSLREAGDINDQISLLAQAMQLPMEDMDMFIDALPNQLINNLSPAIYVAGKSQPAQAQPAAQLSKLGVCGAYQGNEEKSIYPLFDAE